MILTQISELIARLMPFFRASWIITILIGAWLILLSIFLRKKPNHKVSPWVISSFGVLMMISSGVQLTLSLR